jgi:hypothetical protein
MRLKNESGVYAQFVRICYSFGNRQATYLFNPELEKTKHLLHNAVIFQCKKSLDAANKMVGASLKMPEGETWNERRLALRLQIRRAGKRCDLEQLQQLEQLQRLLRLQQLERLEQNITFTNLDYRDVKIITPPEETLVYLDPPYRGTEKYIEGINYNELDAFFTNLPCGAFMSEYNAPFDCIHEIKTRSTFHQNNSTPKIERLYINRPVL